MKNKDKSLLSLEGDATIHAIEVMRRTGRSTRAIDKAVQCLFTTGECRVWDHHPTREASHHLMERVLQRLSIEHNMTVNNGYLSVNKSNLTIRLA